MVLQPTQSKGTAVTVDNNTGATNTGNLIIPFITVFIARDGCKWISAFKKGLKYNAFLFFHVNFLILLYYTPVIKDLK